MPQIGSFHCLPPSKELLLEIQVSNFINDFLFPGVDDRKAAGVSSNPRKVESSAFDSHGEKENIFASIFCTSPLEPDVSHRNAAVLVDIPTHDLPMGNDLISNACQRNVHGRCLYNSTIPEEITINVREQEGNSSEVGVETSDNQPSITSSEASSEFCTSQSQLGRYMPKASFHEDAANPESSNSPQDFEAMAIGGGEGMNVSRMESFPCKSKAQRERQLPKNDCKAERQIKHSCRKPPRPPRPAKLPSEESCSGLLRCTSDTNLLLQSTRRVKTERKRKMAAASSASSTSMWALVFTLCFAIAIVVQGVLSQGKQSLAIEASNASSPANSYTSSIKMNVPASQSSAIPLDAQSGGGWGNSGQSESKSNEGRERNIQVVRMRKEFDSQERKD